MGHRWIRLATLAVAASLAVAGCGSSSGSGGGTLKIGVLAPFSGIYTVAGNPVKDGAAFWLKQHGGKLAGRKVDLVVADDKSTTQGAVSAANDLTRQQNVSAVVGLVNSAGALAARPTLMRSKVITMSVVANATELLDTQKGPYLFMVNPAANETAAPAAVLAQKQGWNDVVGVGDNYVGARTWLDPSLDAMGQVGLTVKSRIYPPFPTSDYGPYISKLATLSPGLVAPVMFGPSAAGFLKAYGSFGQKAPIYTTGSMLEPTSVSGDLLSVARGVYAYWNYSPALETPENKAFVSGFKAAYHRVPGGFEMQSYAAMELLDKAYAQAGRKASPDAVAAALRTISVDSPVGPLSLGDRQAVSWNVYLTKVAPGPDGQLQLVPVGPYVKAAHPNMTVAEARAALAELPNAAG